MAEVHACEQLAQGCYLEADRLRFEPATFWVASERSTVAPAMQATHTRRVTLLKSQNFVEVYLYLGALICPTAVTIKPMRQPP